VSLVCFRPRAGRWLLAVGLVLAGASAAAQAPPVEAPDEPAPEVTEEEKRALEEALGKDAAAARELAPPLPASGVGRVLQSMNPDLSFVADVALAYFSVADPLEGGAHDPARTGFNLQQLEMAVGQAVDPYFRFDAFLVFSQFGVEVEEAYATTLSLPHRTQLRLGQFLTRFGRLNATHPHAWHFVDQPFALTRVFGGESNRGLGAEGSWLAPLPWYLELVGSVTEAGGAATARSFLGGGTYRLTSPLDFQFTTAVKQFFPFGDDVSLLWGLSAANGPNPTGAGNRTDVFGTDLYVKYRPITVAGDQTVVSLQSEVLYRRRQLPRALLTDLSGYAQLFYGAHHRWGVAARYELGTPSLGQDGRVADDPLDPEWRRARQRVAANVTVWPTEFSRARLQGSVDLPGWREGPEWSVALNFEFSVGAHGAHAF
jgi:hypothetical protein